MGELPVPSCLGCKFSVRVGQSGEIAIPREARRLSGRALVCVLVITMQREMLIDRILKAESEMQRILRGCRSVYNCSPSLRLVFLVMIESSGLQIDP